MSSIRKLYKDKVNSDEIAQTSYSHKDQTLNVNMTHIGKCGYSFVLKGCMMWCVPLEWMFLNFYMYFGNEI